MAPARPLGTSGSWSRTADLTGSGAAANDGFGFSVAISGTAAVIGAYDDKTGTSLACIFTATKGRWKQAAQIGRPGTCTLGVSAAIWHSTAIIGTGVDWGQAGICFLKGRAYLFQA